MDFITFFNPTGSTGRTTAVMALASAIIADGKVKSAVMDMTEEAGPPGRDARSSLSLWEDKMAECGIGFADFRVEEVYNFESMIRADCWCDADEFWYMLVDTPKRTNDLVLNMVRRSQMIIVPFRNASEAAASSKWLAKRLNKKALIFGLVTGVDDDEEYQIARSAFTGFPVLENYLPKARVFEQQHQTGHLFHSNLIEEEQDQTLENFLVGVTDAHARISASCLWDEVSKILLNNERVWEVRTA